MVETINKLLRVSRRLVQEYGREPTSEEIGSGMDVTPERVREILKISQEPVSLETPSGEKRTATSETSSRTAAPSLPPTQHPTSSSRSRSMMSSTP